MQPCGVCYIVPCASVVPFACFPACRCCDARPAIVVRPLGLLYCPPRRPVLVHGLLAGAQGPGSVAAACGTRRSKQGLNADAGRCTQNSRKGHATMARPTAGGRPPNQGPSSRRHHGVIGRQRMAGYVTRDRNKGNDHDETPHLARRHGRPGRCAASPRPGAAQAAKTTDRLVARDDRGSGGAVTRIADTFNQSQTAVEVQAIYKGGYADLLNRPSRLRAPARRRISRRFSRSAPAPCSPPGKR